MNNTTNNGNRPALSFYHPNGRGTGAAAKFALHPANAEREGYVEMRLAPQTAGVSRFPAFDWEGHPELGARLCFADICAFLQVLRGECESIEDGKGLFHCTASANVRICLRHIVEPVCGYEVSLATSSRTEVGKGGEITRFKGLGEINQEEFSAFIGKDMRLTPVDCHHDTALNATLQFYMGSNTPERKDYIMDSLVCDSSEF